MARPVRKTLSAAGVTPAIPMSLHQYTFNVSLSVALAAGSVLTYTVEHTFDDVFASDFNPATAVWFSNDVLVDRTTSEDGNYAFPVTAIRLNITSYTSGSAKLTVIQSGVGQ